MRRRTLPERAAASTFSDPLMRLPARASIPRRSSTVWRSAFSTRSPKSAGTSTSLVLKARWRAALSFPLELASSSSALPTPIHAPRPGARARTSGATDPSGPSASRISSSRVPLRRVRIHVLSGTCASFSSVTASPVSLGGFRNSVLPALFGLGVLGRRFFILEPVGAGSHDDLVALLVGQAIFGQNSALVLGPVARLAAARLDPLLLDQLVRGEIGEIVQGTDVRLAQGHKHLLGEVRDFSQSILDPQLPPLFTRCSLPALECLGCAVLKLRSNVVVEAFDRCDFVDLHVGDLFEAGEALGDEQLRQGLVHVELALEHLRTLDELALALLTRVGFREDVDLRSGEMARQAYVLTAAADRKAELIVRNDDFDPALFLIDDDAADRCRLEGVDDEGRKILAPRDDVDLFALQLLNDGLDTAALHADAGANRIDGAVVADHADFGAAARIACRGLDLNDSVVDF